MSKPRSFLLLALVVASLICPCLSRSAMATDDLVTGEIIRDGDTFTAFTHAYNDTGLIQTFSFYVVLETTCSYQELVVYEDHLSLPGSTITVKASFGLEYCNPQYSGAVNSYVYRRLLSGELVFYGFAHVPFKVVR